MAITSLNASDNGSTSRTTINDNFTDLDTTKADLASPTFTGLVTTPAIKITTGASAGYLLQSDADGDASWVQASGTITIETTTGVTHSLTTTAGQKVVVWAKGNILFSTNVDTTCLLAYNGVTKDTTAHKVDASGVTRRHAFALMYTETPGAATQNVTVTAGAGTLENVVIIVMKIG